MNTPKIQHVVYMKDQETFYDHGYTFNCYRTIDTVDGSEHWYYMIYPNKTCEQMCVIEEEKNYKCCSDNSIFIY